MLPRLLVVFFEKYLAPNGDKGRKSNMDFETILLGIMSSEKEKASKESVKKTDDKKAKNKPAKETEDRTHLVFTATVDGSDVTTNLTGESTPVTLIALCSTIMSDILRILYKDCWLDAKDDFIRKTLEILYITAGLRVEEMIASNKDREDEE